LGENDVPPNDIRTRGNGDTVAFYQVGLQRNAKIIKIVATRCHILKLKCTKFDFGWCSTYIAPRTPWLDLRWPTSKEREGRKDGREGYMPYEITQCYLPLGRGDFPAFTPAEAGTRFSDPGGMQG